MNHDITTRTANSITDNRVVVVNTVPLARTLEIGTTWNSILLGVRFAFDRVGSLSAGPMVYFGMLNGTTNIPTGSGTVSHFVGIRSDPSTPFTEQTGGFGFHKTAPTKIENGTATAGTSQYTDVKAASSGRGIWFLKITKGSPNYTFHAWFTGTTSEWTRSEFGLEMDSGAPADTDIINQINGATMAVDEATYGGLDSVCFAYSGTDAMEVLDFAAKKLS